jgi:hypothetical protein
MSLKQEIVSFLGATFPGSTLDDGYFFVVMKAAHALAVPHGAAQRVVDKLCAGRCWLVCVGGDPGSHVRASRSEKDTVRYTPDYDIAQPMERWWLALDPAPVDLQTIRTAMSPPSALLFVDPEHRVAFHANFNRVYAASAEALEAFRAGLEEIPA